MWIYMYMYMHLHVWHLRATCSYSSVKCIQCESLNQKTSLSIFSIQIVTSRLTAWMTFAMSTKLGLADHTCMPQQKVLADIWRLDHYLVWGTNINIFKIGWLFINVYLGCHAMLRIVNANTHCIHLHDVAWISLRSVCGSGRRKGCLICKPL